MVYNRKLSANMQICYILNTEVDIVSEYKSFTLNYVLLQCVPLLNFKHMLMSPLKFSELMVFALFGCGGIGFLDFLQHGLWLNICSGYRTTFHNSRLSSSFFHGLI